jgi:hypothetical protein
MTGFIVERAGYNAGFLVLAAIAIGALAVLGLAMPETSAISRGTEVGDSDVV